MKTIGLIGGMSWLSSMEYYRLINEETQRRLGGHHSARCVMVSLDFAEIVALQRSGDWEQAGALLAAAGRRAEAAGVDVLVLCTNLMHKVAGSITAATDVPFLHIVDAVASEAGRRGFHTLGLLGTRWTMEEDFYRLRFKERHGIEMLIPDEPDRAEVDRVIFEELTQGRIEAASRSTYIEIIGRLRDRGAQGVVLGCTEIMLLVSEGDSPIPVLDSTRIHARQALDFALTDSD